jgi:hypothetical protein
VTSDKASERIRKLRAVTVPRGATAHEAATASALADQLAARFGLDCGAPALRPARVARPQVAHYARSARTDRRAPGSLRFVAFG